jgi:hypothetical protein
MGGSAPVNKNHEPHEPHERHEHNKIFFALPACGQGRALRYNLLAIIAGAAHLQSPKVFPPPAKLALNP